MSHCLLPCKTSWVCQRQAPGAGPQRGTRECLRVVIWLLRLWPSHPHPRQEEEGQGEVSFP